MDSLCKIERSEPLHKRWAEEEEFKSVFDSRIRVYISHKLDEKLHDYQKVRTFLVHSKLHPPHKRGRAVRLPRPSIGRESAEVAGIDDSAARARLARVVGLPTLPKREWSAFDKLPGFFDNILRHEKERNPVALVRRIRRG